MANNVLVDALLNAVFPIKGAYDAVAGSFTGQAPKPVQNVIPPVAAYNAMYKPAEKLITTPSEQIMQQLGPTIAPILAGLVGSKPTQSPVKPPVQQPSQVAQQPMQQTTIPPQVQSVVQQQPQQQPQPPAGVNWGQILTQIGIPLATAGIGMAVPGALPGAAGFSQGYAGALDKQRERDSELALKTTDETDTKVELTADQKNAISASKNTVAMIQELKKMLDDPEIKTGGFSYRFSNAPGSQMYLSKAGTDKETRLYALMRRLQAEYLKAQTGAQRGYKEMAYLLPALAQLDIEDNKRAKLIMEDVEEGLNKFIERTSGMEK